MWMIIPIHVWLVKDREGVTLVDAGIPIMANGILKAINKLNIGPLSRILLTHGHADHVGAIKRIRSKRNIPIYVHPEEIPYMEGKKPYPRRKKAKTLVQPSLVKPLKQNGDRLKQVGDLIPYHTPGHSPGHVVYYHQKDNVLLGGDLFTSKRRRIQKPMAIFTADMTQAIKSGGIIKSLKPEILCVCHGNEVTYPHKQYDRVREQLHL